MADGDPPLPVLPDDTDSQPKLSNGKPKPYLRRIIQKKWPRNIYSENMKLYDNSNVMHKNIAKDILSFSVDEIDIPYMLLSVIGDSTEFQPKEWSKLSFQTAILETVNRAEECLVMYVQPGSGAMIGSLVENTLKNHSIGVDRFLTFRYRKTENDTFDNPMDTGLCLYSHKLMTVCDLRSSRSVMKRKIPKPDHESISNIMFEIEKYFHEVGRIEIEFVTEVDKVPVVLVLAEGDMTSIHHVLEAVKIDTIVYIIKGSGKAADVIVDYLNDKNSLKESVAKHFGLAFLKKKEKLIQLEQYLITIIEDYRWMITVFDIDKEEPKVLADMISDSVSSLWELSPAKQFKDGYMWIPNIYIPLAYRYIQLHREFGSQKASSLLEQAFRVSANIVKRLLDNGTSLRKIYEQEQDNYVYSLTIKETPIKSPLSSFTAVSSRKKDKVNNYRRRLQFLRGYCRRMIGYTTGTELFFGSSPDMSFERALKGYMSEELLSELFMFEFLLSNDHEIADIFWHRCPNQLMTALVMSAFLEKKSKVELALRKKRLCTDLMNISKSFQARAIYILDRMYNVSERDETEVDDDNDEFTTEERFTEDPVGEEFRILSEPVNVMGLEITPLEFAFNNERLDFLSHSTSQRYLLTQWTAKNKKAINCMEQVWKFMAAPRTKFYVSYVFFFLAMICCSIFTLTDVNLITSFSEISKYQIAFTIWIVGDFLEEFVVEFFLEKWERQVQSVLVRIKLWMRDFLNWLDLACYLSYSFGVLSHYLSTDPQTLITRRLYSLTVVFMYLRFLRVMLMSKNIGTKVIMIAYMTKDLLSFLRILVIIIIGVGVGYHANIFPNFSPLFYDDWGDRWMDARIFSIIAMPFWQIFGDPNLDDLENEAISYCESRNETSDCKMDFSVPLTSFVFMMFGNVLLINLVIAMFSNRFSAVESNSERAWNYRFTSIVIEYRTRLPSPINLMIRPIQILFYPCRNSNWCRRRKIGVLEKSYLFTGSEHKYQNVTPDGIDSSTTSFQFRIQTDGDVYVGLFCYPPDQREGEMIEIMISGNNSEDVVITHRKKDILVTKDTENILDKSSFREFEITWSEKEMQVESRTYTGNATDGYIPQKKKIIKATCSIKDINCVAYHTSNHSAGVWKFSTGTRERGFNESSTPEQKGYESAKYFDLDKNETSVIFKVKAKCDVNLAFFKKSENEKSLHELDQENFEMLKVVIGGCANTKSWISYTNCQKS
ncbi:hypothetical protein KUTeg_008755 [Tegillarca granosa]|uniref:Uncharacterized protein n=1 Tax=Tegillarca granosa TaxID=220873 RepID=A0ABQ9FA12_TEGGR|nr:hypothetical protein KUTeg_008755 [Tegillarca granosa]